MWFCLVVYGFEDKREKKEKKKNSTGDECFLKPGAFVLYLMGQNIALCDCTLHIKVSDYKCIPESLCTFLD